MFQKCPKCGGTRIVGPSYEKRAWGQERLRYHCLCGYSWTEPTQDAQHTRAGRQE